MGEPADRPEIHAENHVGIEYPQQRFEIAAPRGSQEGVHHPALQGDVTIGLRGRLHPAGRRLASDGPSPGSGP